MYKYHNNQDKDQYVLENIHHANLDIEDINIYENGDKILNHLIKMYYIKYAFDKLLKNLKLSKQKYFLKMLKQRIYKIINQYVFQKLKLNDKKLLNKKNKES